MGGSEWAFRHSTLGKGRVVALALYYSERSDLQVVLELGSEWRIGIPLPYSHNMQG